ncbi:type II secretion system F family protein [Yimella sp. cx-51]|uniref:type II secretion system F family protein n=1 Tax=Yimella sp. cx-51 TaxID=2770551 RepID=UPI00165D3F7D|nr:type II secretion system F family protein [Yimella sp. cx-51]MBC9956100.1 type II secretion system F family protein [Yimella sp. cx-51]QTH37370.1 type II secretion system F family protein [Yimella sp. cx-51]
MNVDLGWLGALCGLVAALGLALVWQRLPARRTPSLADCIEPYVAQAPRPSKYLGPSDARGGRAGTMVLRRIGSIVDSVLGGSASVNRRLERAGSRSSLEDFRAEQALYGCIAALAATLWVSMRVAAGNQSPLTAVLLVLIAAGGGVVLRDQLLTRAAEKRDRQILAEFPAVAELLALAVTAGEGAAAALERVARLSKGELAGELSRCLIDARAGASLPEALQGLADRTGLASLARFVDGIVVALERGTPLADVMRAQAQDARDAAKQELIELGGRRELAMMVPVVFLVLPVTILFAVWPGLAALRLTM